MNVKMGAGVLITKHDLILCLRRSDTGQVALPFGKVEPGESPVNAAARECAEETGYKPLFLNHLYPPFVERADDGILAVTYRAQAESWEPLTTPSEGEVVWLTAEELRKSNLGFPKYNLRMLDFFGI